MGNMNWPAFWNLYHFHTFIIKFLFDFEMNGTMAGIECLIGSTSNGPMDDLGTDITIGSIKSRIPLARFVTRWIFFMQLWKWKVPMYFATHSDDCTEWCKLKPILRCVFLLL